MLKAVKLALRIKSSAFNNELNGLISAAIADLQLAGVSSAGQTDPLMELAVILYVKSHFGLDNKDAEKYLKIYNDLKARLSLAQKYEEGGIK
ncbi:MAG: head-tail connector protein [Oscillospiraceae bacterium]|nr:head-tail connector protein [Oscillospiraceae bacterium]